MRSNETLLRALQACLKTVSPGANWKPKISQQAPSIYESFVIHERDSMPSINVLDEYQAPMKASLDEAVGIYEEFLHGFVLGEDLTRSEHPVEFLQRRLGTTKGFATWLYDQRTAERLLPLLVWHIGKAFPGQLIVNENEVSYRSGKYELGVTPNGVLSRFPTNGKVLPANLPVISGHHLRAKPMSMRGDELRHVAHCIQAQPDKQGLSQAFGLLLRVTGFNRDYLARKIVPDAVQVELESFEPEELSKLIWWLEGKDAAGTLALRRIRSSVVPIFMKSAEFTKLFGNPYQQYKTSARNRDKWLELIKGLNETHRTA
jgi:hypothetical protein